MTGSLEQSGNLKPTYARDQETLWREIRKLWAGVNNRTRGTIKDVPFALSGDIFISSSSRYYLRNGGTLQRILMSIDEPGSTSTTVTIYKNLDVVTTITLGAGIDKTQVILSESFEPDTDYIRVAVTTAGAAAVGLTVQCRFLIRGD